MYNKLNDALAEFKDQVKKKRFESNLLRAARLFADEIVNTARKEKQKEKKAPKREKVN